MGKISGGLVLNNSSGVSAAVTKPNTNAYKAFKPLKIGGHQSSIHTGN